jgi:hypothetical protein
MLGLARVGLTAQLRPSRAAAAAPRAWVNSASTRFNRSTCSPCTPAFASARAFTVTSSVLAAPNPFRVTPCTRRSASSSAVKVATEAFADCNAVFKSSACFSIS